MFGRDVEVAGIVRSLEGGGNLVVAGPRRTGKTSVCDAALARLRATGCYVAAVDLFRLADTADLAEALVLEVIANRGPLARLAHAARQAGRKMADAAALTATTRAHMELGEEIDIAFRPGLASKDPDRYLTYALELPQRIAAQDRRRLVLFFDEFQEISATRNPFGDPDRLAKLMRAIFQRSPEVSFLFAGSVEHVMRDLFAPAERALSQFGSFYPVPPVIPKEAWTLGITERLAEDDCEIDPAALERLIDVGEGHPRVTMLIARWTHESSLVDETHRLTETHVSAGIRMAQLSDMPKHEQTLARIRSLGRHAQRMAIYVADGSPVSRGGLNPKIVSTTLSSLRDAGIIEQQEPRKWRVTDPLLRNFLADLER
jgi:DNA-binding transcriptional ArsR family regulator